MLHQLKHQALGTKAGTLPKINVIGSPVTALPFDDQMKVILHWAKSRLSKTVCVANTHMLVEAYRRPKFRAVLRRSDLVTPDGMPLVWMMKVMGALRQNRVAGMDIFLSLCEAAPRQETSIFLLGSQSAVLRQMQIKLEDEFPDLQIAGMEPLPFRPLTTLEDDELIQRINASGAGLVFLALGCPKQEAWIAQHKGRIRAVMLGVGGVFPVYAGIQKRAPRWIRESGLEWLYRLVQEPTRLWKRYGTTIPLFVYLALKQALQHKVANGYLKRSQV
ncbi:WecB/TagA/CpsF family glycosyltransferase [Acaryochloris thomasi]|nr:WecB/TagA/CpsF family glycosyltransferase [Acaryochloris thomasi]